MSRQPETDQGLVRKLRQQKRVIARLANSTPYALSGTSVIAPGLVKVDERLVAGTPGGSRVELDSAGLRKYAADGTTVQVDLTGDVAAFSGLITGSEIIAGTAGAARVELDSSGLRVYAADGTTVLLNTADDATIRVRGDSAAFGFEAQPALTTGVQNTAIGVLAQHVLTIGNVNTAIGSNAQKALTTGGWNAAIGAAAQQKLTTGSDNTAIGTAAQADGSNATTTANYQTSIGPFTGQSSATQVDGITTIGYQATAGAANATSIGREARADHAGSIALGYQALTTQTNQVMVGPRDVEITDTTKGLVLVSPDATRRRITAANDGSLLVNGVAIGGGGGGTPASETVAGIVELATSAETVTGTDDQRAVTPAGVKAAIDASGAWTALTPGAGWQAFSAGTLPKWKQVGNIVTLTSGRFTRAGSTLVLAANTDYALAAAIPSAVRPLVDQDGWSEYRAGSSTHNIGSARFTAAGVLVFSTSTATGTIGIGGGTNIVMTASMTWAL